MGGRLWNVTSFLSSIDNEWDRNQTRDDIDLHCATRLQPTVIDYIYEDCVYISLVLFVKNYSVRSQCHPIAPISDSRIDVQLTLQETRSIFIILNN